MNKNVKIAKELVKLAKSLVAGYELANPDEKIDVKKIWDMMKSDGTTIKISVYNFEDGNATMNVKFEKVNKDTTNLIVDNCLDEYAREINNFIRKIASNNSVSLLYSIEEQTKGAGFNYYCEIDLYDFFKDNGADRSFLTKIKDTFDGNGEFSTDDDRKKMHEIIKKNAGSNFNGVPIQVIAVDTKGGWIS